MTTLQKVIKYLALAFAFFIIVNIISAILFGIYSLASVLGLKQSESEPAQTDSLKDMTVNMESNQIATLKIELEHTNLKIQKGEALKVESNSSHISCTQNHNQLVIKEKEHNWFLNNDASELIIYIPEDKTLDHVKMDTGAGEIYIEKLQTRELDFEIGAGKVEIQNLNVLNKAQIDGGAGKVEVLDGEINNLDLDMGVGETILNTKLSGNNDIDAGVGKLEIELTDEIENYTIKVKKGIGSITIDEKEAADNTVYGSGETYIKVDGGVGAIIIK